MFIQPVDFFFQTVDLGGGDLQFFAALLACRMGQIRAQVEKIVLDAPQHVVRKA